MTPQRIIELAKRAEDAGKLKDLLAYRRGHTPLSGMTITIRKGHLTKSITISNQEDMNRILDMVNDIVQDIERTLTKINENAPAAGTA